MNHEWFTFAEHLRAELNIPIISELYISTYDTAVRDRKIVQEESTEGKRLRQLDRSIIERSDALIHLSRNELQYIANLVDARINWDRTTISPLSIDPKRWRTTQHRWDGIRPYILCWWGTYLPLHGLERVLQAVSLLQTQGFPAKLHIFGPPGAHQSAEPYRLLARQLSIESCVEFHHDATFSNGQLEPFILENCDLALGIFGSSEKAAQCITNKLIDALAMQVPVLTRTGPGLSEFFDGSEFLTSGIDPHEIAAAVHRAATEPATLDDMVRQGFERYEQKFNINQYTHAVLSTLARVAPR